MIKIALIDSGINRESTVSKHRILSGITFDSKLDVIYSSEEFDDNGHGTFCANVILSRTTLSVIRPIKILNSQLKSNSELLIAALKILLDSDINIVNLSLSTSNPQYSDEIEMICNELYESGKIIVASYDNGGAISYPASFKNVLGVKGRFMNDASEYWFNGEDVIADYTPIMRQISNEKKCLAGGNSKATALITSYIASIWESDPNQSKEDVLKSFQVRAKKDKWSTEEYTQLSYPYAKQEIDNRLSENEKRLLLDTIDQFKNIKFEQGNAITQPLFICGLTKDNCFDLAYRLQEAYKVDLHVNEMNYKSFYSVANLSYVIGDAINEKT